MKRASYKSAIAFIALNDEPTDMDPESVAGYTTSVLVSEIFDVPTEKVGVDVVKFRLKQEEVYEEA